MPGFDTLGARLARSRRRLERERAAVKVERLGRDELDVAVHDDDASIAVATSAQVIMFPRQGARVRN
jgi:hypothetical protein